MKKWVFLLAPALLALSACNDNDNGGGNGEASCDLDIEMAVTGELTPQYSWSGGDVWSLTVTRVENLDYIAANPVACAAAPGAGGRDDRCKIAYNRTSLPTVETAGRNMVTSPTTHGAAGGLPDTVALTEESPLANGVEYQLSLTRVKPNGEPDGCGCLRFTAGTAKSGDGSCS